MPVDSDASGEKWLCHPKAMQVYLSLLDTSENKDTLEACCGTLQNLTAGRGLVSLKSIIIRLSVGEADRDVVGLMTMAPVTKADWFGEKGWSLVDSDSDVIKERKKDRKSERYVNCQIIAVVLGTVMCATVKCCWRHN